MKYISLLLFVAYHQLTCAQTTNQLGNRVAFSFSMLSCAKPSGQMPPSMIPTRDLTPEAKKAKGLLIGGCISVGLCAGLIVAGTTLATQPVNSYTEGIIFLGGGLGMGVVAIPLLVLAQKHKKDS